MSTHKEPLSEYVPVQLRKLRFKGPGNQVDFAKGLIKTHGFAKAKSIAESCAGVDGDISYWGQVRNFMQCEARRIVERKHG